MSASTKSRERETRREYVTVWWCWPGSKFGGYVWGSLFVLGGAVGLLANLGWVTEATLETFWPLALVALGLVYLLRASRGKVRWPGG